MPTLKYFFQVRRSQAHRVSSLSSAGIHRVSFPCSIHSFTNTTFSDGSVEKPSEHTALAFDPWHISLFCAWVLSPVCLQPNIIDSQAWGQGTQSSDLLSLHCCKGEAGFPSLPAASLPPTDRSHCPAQRSLQFSLAQTHWVRNSQHKATSSH